MLDFNGLRLIDLCQSTGLLIANGRLSNDQNIGNFTFCSHLGQSAVDYLLMNFSDFRTISYFDILAFNEHSDLATISFHLPLKMCTTENNKENGAGSISRKIVLDKTKLDNFKLKLQDNIEAFKQTINRAANESIDDTVQSFTRLLHDMAFDTFGKTFKTKNYTTEHTKTTNEWFDESCSNARSDFNVARNAFNRVRNDETRRNFTRTRTRYNKVKKKAKQQFKLKEGQRISKLAKRDSQILENIPQTFKNKRDEADSLSIDDLYAYFKSVFDESQENTNQNNIPNDNQNDSNNTEHMN